MKQLVKDFLNTRPRFVFCNHLYTLTGGYANEGGDYDAAQKWLAKNGWYYDPNIDAWKKA